MQRLFSMFPNAWPGAGLLLLRLVSGGLLVYEGLLGPRSLGPRPLAGVAGALLIAGLWTPVAGALVAAFEVWQALSTAQDLRSSLLLGTIAAALAMIGPGATSLDNLLFGRKRMG